MKRIRFQLPFLSATVAEIDTMSMRAATDKTKTLFLITAPFVGAKSDWVTNKK